MDLLPIDLEGVLMDAMEGDKRAPDGLLHASSHLVSSLRHAQLDVAGAPQTRESFPDLLNLRVGTAIHEFVTQALMRRGIMAMHEIKLNDYLPDGWGGTLDVLFWHPEYKAFVLGDYKTIKAEGLPFVASQGAKEEHIAQTSLYWHACVRAGLPMVKGIGVAYLPKGRSSRPGDEVSFLVSEFEPLPAEELDAICAARWLAISDYLDSLVDARPGIEGYLTDALAPVQERVQKVVWVPKAGNWDVVLKPHYTAAYCKYPELCGCGNQGQTKIGTWMLDSDDVLCFTPRAGFGEYDSTTALRPTGAEIKRRRKSASSEPVAPF